MIKTQVKYTAAHYSSQLCSRSVQTSPDLHLYVANNTTINKGTGNKTKQTVEGVLHKQTQNHKKQSKKNKVVTVSQKESCEHVASLHLVVRVHAWQLKEGVLLVVLHQIADCTLPLSCQWD